MGVSPNGWFIMENVMENASLCPLVWNFQFPQVPQAAILRLSLTKLQQDAAKSFEVTLCFRPIRQAEQCSLEAQTALYTRPCLLCASVGKRSTARVQNNAKSGSLAKLYQNNKEDHAKVAVSMTKLYFTSDFTARS